MKNRIDNAVSVGSADSDGVEDFALLSAFEAATYSMEKGGSNKGFVERVKEILDEREWQTEDFMKNDKLELKGGGYARHVAYVCMNKEAWGRSRHYCFVK